VEGGIYNVRKATCGIICTNCTGYSGYGIDLNPFAVAVGSNIQETFYGQYSSGTQYNLTSNATWSSSDTTVATVSAGLVQGLDEGSPTIYAELLEIDPGEVCVAAGDPIHCTMLYFGASAPGNVTQAIPTKFISSPGTSLSNGALFFTYSWSSSSGKLSDLSSCTAGESVYYPNYPSTPYVWPLPMVASTINPGVVSGNASSGGFEDTNSPPDSFQQPYSSASFQATQRLWWSCPYWNNGSLNYFVPDITIARSVFKDTDGFWKYSITKSGASNTIKLPNQ
jgi:hypothetical protein